MRHRLVELEDAEEAADDGDEDARRFLESLEEDEFGGFAYELCYLRFRIKPPDDYVGDEVDEFYEEYLKPQEERLWDLLEPSYGDQLAFNKAWILLWEYEQYGLPHAGGYLDQPADWRFVLNCAKTAQQRAESNHQREEAKANKSRASETPETPTPDLPY